MENGQVIHLFQQFTLFIITIVIDRIECKSAKKSNEILHKERGPVLKAHPTFACTGRRNTYTLRFTVFSSITILILF